MLFDPSVFKDKYSCILGVIIILCNNPVILLIRALDKGDLSIIQICFFLFLKQNICCDASLEQSRRDGSNDGSQICFFTEQYG